MAHDVDSGPGSGSGIEFGVVNYNGGDAVVGCVASILGQEPGPVRVTVFDNASDDGSPDALEAEFGERVVVIRNEENLGYAGALNRLLDRASAEVVVLCNMDLRFEAGWTAAVDRAFRADPGAGGLATLVLEETEPPVINSLGVRFYADLHAQNVGSGEIYSPETVRRGLERAFGSYGAVMCFRREAVADLRFDESYFLFFEETDFLLRYRLLGRRTVFAPGAVARHRRSLSTRRYSPLKLYYGERNRVTTVLKLLPVWYWPVAAVHTLVRYGTLRMRTAAGGRAGGEPDSAPAMPSTGVIIRTLLRAWLHALARLPSTLRSRRRFWRRAETTPRDALTLMRQYQLDRDDLRIR